MEALLNFGANINIQNNEGNTPLHLAVINNSNLVQSLIEFGANPHMINRAK